MSLDLLLDASHLVYLFLLEIVAQVSFLVFEHSVHGALPLDYFESLVLLFLKHPDFTELLQDSLTLYLGESEPRSFLLLRHLLKLSIFFLLLQLKCFLLLFHGDVLIVHL